MEIKLTERKEIIVAGISIETTYENNNKDREILFSNFHNGKKELLSNYAKKSNEFYCATWLAGKSDSNGSEVIVYLLSQEITEQTSSFETKIIPAGLYACAKFPKNNNDTLEAWEKIYEKIYEDRPKTGYRSTSGNNVQPHFEYYPNGLDEDYELWISLEKDE